MNKLLLVGRLTKDPVSKGTEEKPVCYFTLAANRDFTNASGEREADFIDLKAFKGLAKNCSKYLTKGSLVSVEAAVRTSIREIDGKKRTTVDFIADKVKFLDIKKSNSNNDEDNQQMDQDEPFPGSEEVGSGDAWPFG